MPRQIRIQYEGAIYHVMNRGHRKGPIFKGEADYLKFLETLGEACEKTQWQVHAYCLMRNHFHLVVETPLANLASGMKWFLGTYTSRYNRKHRYFGSLFSGRYKAIIVDGSGNGYLRTVCDYVHLNPVRAKLLKEEEPLQAFRWSSYPEYLKKPAQRAAWLRVDRLLGEMPIPQDSAAGRREFKLVTEERRKRDKGMPEERKLKRTWCLGDEQFKQELLKQMHGKGGKNHYGSERQEAAEAKAQRFLREELRRLRWTTKELGQRRKGDPEKVRIARRLRKETTVTLKRVAQHLHMGSWSHAANKLYACQKDKK